MGEVLKLRGPQPNERLVGRAELAEMLQISTSSLDRWRKHGLPMESEGWRIKVIRFSPSKVRQWIEANKKLV